MTPHTQRNHKSTRRNCPGISAEGSGIVPIQSACWHLNPFCPICSPCSSAFQNFSGSLCSPSMICDYSLVFSPLQLSEYLTVLHSALGIIFYFSTLKKVTCSESLWCAYRHSMRWFTCWDPKTGRLPHKVPQRDRAARRAAGRNAEGGLPRSYRSHGLWCFFLRSCAWIQRSLVPVLAVSGSSSVTLDFSLPLTLLTGNIIKLKIPLGLKLFIMTLQMLWFNSLLMTPHSIAIWGLSMRHEIID